jgi:hypothetical protein
LRPQWLPTFRGEPAYVKPIAERSIGGPLRIRCFALPRGGSIVAKHSSRTQADCQRQRKSNNLVHISFLFPEPQAYSRSGLAADRCGR